jgi:hypothetical protein
MILEKVVSTKISVIIASIVQTILEVRINEAKRTIFCLFNASNPKRLQYFRISNARRNSIKKAHSITHLVELLEYTEYEDVYHDGEKVSPSMNRSSRRLATNPFQARVRISNSNTTVVKHGAWSLQQYISIGQDHEQSPDYPHTPSSFPGSPVARARYMSVSDVEVDSVVFRARDKLRLETQSASSDALSRTAASRVLKAGRNIAFDAHFSLTDTFLACGNHYILKTGSGGSCSTCRATVPVWQGVNVYLEFSITSQSDVNPSSFVSGPVDLSIGLIPADCPPNVTAGQWPHSVGLFSDGRLFVSGNECNYKDAIDCGERASSLVQVVASTTIGMLIYIPHPRDEGNESAGSPSSGHQQRGANRNGETNFSAVDNDLDDIDLLAIEDAADVDANHRDVSVLTGNDMETNSISPRISGEFSVIYNINGNVVEMNKSSQRSIASSFCNWRSSAPDLYAVVSLVSKNAGSWCRFSASDVVYKSRSAIGAPAGETVYCMDGSLLLESGLS